MASKVSGIIEKIKIGSGSNQAIASTAYGYCETAAGTAAKTVDMTGFELNEGVTIHIKFKEGNSAANPTLNVQGKGAKPIVQYGTTAASTDDSTTGWQAGAILTLTYDGTSWVRDQGYNTNTWRGIVDNLTSSTATTTSLSGKQGYLLANGDARDSTKLALTGGILTGGLEIKGHIAGDSSTTSGHGLYSGGMYHNAYNNIILHGDASTGSSGIAFISDKVAADGTITNRNAPSDRAFIQYHACGVTTATAEGTAPTLASGSEEAGRLVIGIGNDSGDKIILQAPGATDIVHQMGATGYPIPHTTNTNGSVGGTTTPVYIDAGVIKALSYTIAKSVPSDAVFTDHYAWSDITNKPISFTQAAYGTTGWSQLGGRASQSIIKVWKPTDTVDWGTAAHSAVISYGVADTKGIIDIAYGSPLVSIAGGNVGGSTDAAPVWYFKLSATSGATYTFPTASKTLAASDGSNASGKWSISTSGKADTAGNADTATAANLTTTTNAIAYYSNTTGTFANGQYVTYLNHIAANAGTNNAGYLDGLLISGMAYGEAENLISGTAGQVSYGDAGPQIRFDSGGQLGAMIFDHYDSTSGMGVSFNFVTNQGYGAAVKANGLIARERAMIGGNSVNGSYVLYSNGATYINGALSMNGVIHTQGSLYEDSRSGAINMNNSDIYGLNSIYTQDSADSAAEGIHFYRSATTVDSLWVNGGNIYFVPNRTIKTDTTESSATTAANSQKVLRLPATITGSRAVYTNGSNGMLAESSVTSTELGYLSGVTSAIQTQLNGKSGTGHTHGNITSDGKITTAITLAQNDYLIIGDNSDGGKLGKGPAFDGSTATKALTQKGTWETFNNYSHPTGDGNLHVPATGTGNNGKFLKAGNSAGNISWASITGADISDNSIARIKMMMTDGMNYAELNDYSCTKWGFTADTTADGHWYTANPLARDKFVSDYYQCNGGETFNIQCEISSTFKGNTTSGGTDSVYIGTAIGLYCYDETTTSKGINYSDRVTADANGTVTTINTDVTTLAAARRFRVFVQSNTWGNYSGTLKIRKLKVIRVSAPKWYGDLSGNSSGVKDYNSGTIITFGYSTAGMASTSWLGSWDGYKLRAISPANAVKSAIGTSAIGAEKTPIYWNGSSFAAGTALKNLAYKDSLTASDIPNLSWNKITSDKPTTLAGYGITDAASSGHSHTLKIGYKSLSVSTSTQTWAARDILYDSNTTIALTTDWDIINAGIYSVVGTGDGSFTGNNNPGTNQNMPYKWGHLIVTRAGDSHGIAQFYIAHTASGAKDASHGIRYRSGWNGNNGWQSWATILDDKNYNLYVPTLTGTGASGTWGISVTGNAANVTGTVAVAHGGTGATDAAGARTNLGLGTAATYDIVGTGSTNGYSSTKVLIPRILTDGVMEVGKYIDFHASAGDTKDYDVRITANTTGLTIGGTTVGTFSGSLIGNADTATNAIYSKYQYHDLLGFCYITTPTYETTTDNSTWTAGTLDKSIFDEKNNTGITLFSNNIIGHRWIWNHNGFSYSGGSYVLISWKYSDPNAKKTIKIESSTDGSSWTERGIVEGVYGGASNLPIKITDYGGAKWIRITILKTSDTGMSVLANLRLLSARPGDQGQGIEYEYPYDWDKDKNITLKGHQYLGANNTYYSGSSTVKWKGIYATDFFGNASTATEFSSNATVTLTGDVTGTSAGSKKSWSIATTIGTGKVTNAMLAGSIANGKLANSKITIAGNDVSLGGSLSDSTLVSSLGLSKAMRFIGVATVAITDGSTTDPVISGYSTKTAGDVIIDKDSSREYVWSTTNKWELLGGDSSYWVSSTGTTAQFWRGDNAWSDTISGGTLKITNQGNTITIGSINNAYGHIYNSANVPFAFNRTILTTSGNLGDTSYPFNNLYLGNHEGTLDGAGIYYKGKQATYRMIRFLNNTSDTYGNGISIGGGGQTIIGAGESADVLVANIGNGGQEEMYISGDNNVTIYTNIQNGWDNKKTFTFKTDGTLQLSNGQVQDKNGLVSFVQNATNVDGTTDWDTLLTPGCYKVQMASWGAAATYHGPNETQSDLYSYGLLLVFRGASNDGENRVEQIYFPHRDNSSNPIYCRMRNGADTTDHTKWQTWHKLTKGVTWSEVSNKPATSVSWTAGTTAGPTVNVTAAGSSASAAIPAASTSASGIVTTGAQSFLGRKTFGYMTLKAYSDNGTAVQWVGDTYLLNNAGTQVGEYWYNCGDATNITTGQYSWRQYSPNSTPNATTTGKYETYALPAVSRGLTENKSYSILTDKGGITLPRGNIQIGTDTDTTERRVSVQTAAGQLYMFAQNYSTGLRGLYAPAHGTGSDTAVLVVDTNNNVTLNGKATNVTGVVAVANGGTGSSTKLEAGLIYDWTAVVQGQKWSRLCFVPYSTNVTGSSIILNIRGTRNGVVYNFTLLINTVHAHDQCHINVLQGSDYSAVKFRGTSDNSGNVYLELNDSANSIASGTTQNVSCHMLILTKGTTQPTLYTAFTDGTTLPSGCTAHELELKAYGGIQTNGRIYADKVYGAVWNDYAEYRETNLLPPGTCVQETDHGRLIAADSRLIPGASIISDTYGYAQGETTNAHTPIAVSGRVLAYPYLPREYYHAGMAVCSAPGGTIDIMTREEIREYPDAIIGIVSEIPEYEYWGSGNVEVNGRIWIKVR